MPVHDWTRVEAGVFHAFHVGWLPVIQRILNDGLLPQGYYALAEQHVGRPITDVLTLHASPAERELPPSPPGAGGTALAEAPPATRRRQTIEPAAFARRRTLAIRHVSGHRLVAILEVVSPANKDRQGHLDDFVGKVMDALEFGIHVVVIDLFPPGQLDAHGIHGLIRQQLEQSQEPYDIPAGEPLTLASYVADRPIEVFLEHAAVGSRLPPAPLFLNPDRYIDVPLEATYQDAYRGMPAFWRRARRPPTDAAVTYYGPNQAAGRDVASSTTAKCGAGITGNVAA